MSADAASAVSMDPNPYNSPRATPGAPARASDSNTAPAAAAMPRSGEALIPIEATPPALRAVAPAAVGVSAPIPTVWPHAMSLPHGVLQPDVSNLRAAATPQSVGPAAQPASGEPIHSVAPATTTAAVKLAIGAHVNVQEYAFPNGTYTGDTKIVRVDAAGQPVLIRDGKGKLTYRNGNTYDGEWAGDKAEGRGKFCWKASGSSYDGQWADDQKSGSGIYTYHQSKEQYDGNWLRDRKHGRGVYTYASGSKYVGEFFEGSAQGTGEYSFHTGDKYVGEWMHDKPNGKGVFYYASGDRYEGEFVDDQKTGRGVFTEASGNTHDGSWINGKKRGEFKVYDTATRVVFVEEWFEGQLLERKSLPAANNSPAETSAAAK